MLRVSPRTLILALSLSFLGGLTFAAQQPEQDQKKAMEAYLKMMATNENHAYLKNFVGEWNVTSQGWMMPGQDPVTSQNAAKYELILGGRFLKTEIKGTMFGQPFEGLQIIGYDNMKKKCISFWIDSTSTAFFETEGTRDESSKTTTETGLWPDPMTGGTVKVKAVTKLVSPDEFSYELYMIGPDGKEFKSLENRCFRKK